ncbi:S41 family peptidase [Massilia sp. S19_KUP03_FR1]|uniref:S41 family peptidase n=1 Tax=Massilia sp. S19_KUP03_FR1 TaxID=3025503 RepID=UPI002FCDDE0D
MKPTAKPTGRLTNTRFCLLPIAFAALLAGCGGGGGSPGVSSATPSSMTPTPTPSTTTPTPDTSKYLASQNFCAAPRSGIDPFTGKGYPDKAGTLTDERTFLRGWIDQTYLWYKEVPSLNPLNYSTAIDYFNALKTPLMTASGAAKDKYHFTYTTAEWNALSGQGVELGYGISWSRNTGANIPRTWVASVVEPGSPAAAAGLRRGDKLLTVDGYDFVNGSDAATVDKINAGLFPEKANEIHRLTLDRNGTTIDVSLTALAVTSAPVKNTKTIDTPTGKVGYLTFDSHNEVSERALIDSITTLKAAGVTDLVLDVRYNGGGLLFIASELAYMIAGPAQTSGKVFEKPIFNDRYADQPAYEFRSTAYGFQTTVPAGTVLPTLNLKRVTLITTGDTCSASESIINSLRGVDVQVDLIGGQTCGKPYAFTPVDNCGTTYFAIQFQGVNQKGFGDYADGFAPTCTVADDLQHAVGDTSEGLLAAALQYRATGVCPVASSSATAQATTPLQMVRPFVSGLSIVRSAR